jgi:hypothetical protein
MKKFGKPAVLKTRSGVLIALTLAAFVLVPLRAEGQGPGQG